MLYVPMKNLRVYLDFSRGDLERSNIKLLIFYRSSLSGFKPG